MGAVPPTLNQSVSSAVTAAGNTALATTTGNGKMIALQIPALGASAVGIAASMGSVWATAAIPFIGPIVAGVTIGLALLFSRKSGGQKIAATQIVDEAEPLLADNVAGYLSNRTPEAQIQALGNFDYVWSQITSPSMCNNPQLGSAGQRCISERVAGGKWDWFALYRNPIANTPPSVPSITQGGRSDTTTTTITNQDGSVSVIPVPDLPDTGLLFAGILAVVAFMGLKS